MFEAIKSWFNRNLSINNNSRELRDLLGCVPSITGASVNYNTVFGLAPFYRAVDLISSKVGAIDCNVYKNSEDSKEKDDSHPASQLLLKRSSPFLSAFSFKQLIVKDALWSGNGYASIMRNHLGEPIEFVPLDPELTIPVVYYNADTLQVSTIKYTTSVNGKEYTLNGEDVIHLKGLGETGGYWGMSLIDYAKQTLGLHLAIRDYGAYYFKNNSITNLIVSVPNYFKGKEQEETFLRGLESRHQGLENSNKPMVLLGGADAKKLSASQEESQWLESIEQAAIVVSQLTGVHPWKLGVKVNSSYASVEAEQLAELSDCYEKWFINLEQEFESKLLRETEKFLGSHSIRFNREQLMATDIKNKIESLTQQVNNGLLTLNEARKMLGQPKADIEEADRFRKPVNIGYADDEPQQPAAPPGQQQPGQPQDQPVGDNSGNQ